MPTLTLGQAEALVVAALTRAIPTKITPARVASALVPRRGRRLERPRPVARADVRRAGEGRKGRWLRHADADARQSPALSRSMPHNGFAYPAIELAETALPGMARSQGIAAAAIRRSHHCGAAGHPVERLADAGLVALSSPTRRQRWRRGAAEGRVRHQSDRLCLPPGRPRAARDRSVAFQGRARQHHDGEAARRENPGRLGARRGRASRPPIPDAALAGTMLPIGDAKGTALALMVELLAAGLTGANFAAEASFFSMPKALRRARTVHHRDRSRRRSRRCVARFAVLAHSIEGSMARGCRARAGWRCARRRRQRVSLSATR